MKPVPNVKDEDQLRKDTQSFFSDYTAVQAAISGVTADKKNSHFKNSYVTLNALLEAVKPVLMANNFILDQSSSAVNVASGITNVVSTVITHTKTGFKKESSLNIPECEGNMQKIGGAITYARRYTLISLLALKAEDDDGETAVGRGTGGWKKPANSKTTIAAGDSF